MKNEMLAALLLTLLVGAAPAQPKGAPAGPDAALMQQVWDAWNTLDPANAAKFYDQSPSDIFFDIAPMQYRGWAEYQAGSKKMLETSFQSVDCRVAEAMPHAAGNWAWSTALVNCATVGKDGSKSPMHFRWTAIWQPKNGKWLIVHEHISTPLPESTGGMRPPRGPRKSVQ